MIKNKTINFVDKIFITICVFLIIYAWINFYIRDLWITFFLSTTFTFACVFLIFFFSEKKEQKNSLNKNHKNVLEEKFLAFRLMRKNEKLLFLKSLFGKQSLIDSDDKGLTLKTGNQIQQILIATDIEKLTQFHLVNLIENLNKNVDVLKIICCEIDSNLNTNLISNLQIELIEKNRFYNELLAPQNMFPDCSNLNKNFKPKRPKELLKNFFIKSKSKSYFSCGLLLIFLSIIIPYHFYYLIVGSILLLFSIICRLHPFDNN